MALGDEWKFQKGMAGSIGSGYNQCSMCGGRFLTSANHICPVNVGLEAQRSKATDAHEQHPLAGAQWSKEQQEYQRGKTSALRGQVSGDHYRKMPIQPAEYTTKNGIGHLAGDAIAYISRYRAKNGKEDLQKAIHSIQLLIELEYG